MDSFADCLEEVNYKKRKVSDSDEEDEDNPDKAVDDESYENQLVLYEPNTLSINTHAVVPFEPSQSIIPFEPRTAFRTYQNIEKYKNKNLKKRKVTICKKIVKTKHRTKKEVGGTHAKKATHDRKKGNTQDAQDE
jgi:hypothetical protein